MFRFMVSLILVNTYCSFGYPVTQNTTRILVAEPLTTLANGCKNSFIADIIKHNIEHCSAPVTPDSQSELECLMFYEASTHLCSYIYPAEIDLKENYTKKIATIEDVETLCDNAKTWKLSNLEKYPLQEKILEKVLSNRRACLKLCSVEDVLNVDSNFYCKFFQWGLDLVKFQSTTIGQESQSSQSISTQNSLQNRTVSLPKIPNSDTLPKIDSEDQNLQPQLINSVKSADVNITNIEVSGQAPNNQASESTSNSHKDIEVVEHKTSEQLTAPSIKADSEKPIPVADEPPKIEKVENTDSELPKPNENKPIIDNNKVKQNEELTGDDEAENEFGNEQELDEESLSDQDDNGNDQIVQSDPKLDVEKTKMAEKKIESITSLQDTRESGMFPNPIQDSFSEDDDHFFPFFLTAIILVVLLYILYHNKTKFTKVILGLIVEGRQTDRRRNSRGHSYRRLDTLEQAMSSNTAAPPTKIIY